MFVLMPDRDGNTGSITIENEAGSSTASQPGEAIVVRDAAAAPDEPKTMDTAKVEEIFSDALAAHPAAPAVYDIYFKPGSAVLDNKSLKLIDEIVTTIGKKQSLDISINGHSDRMGSDKYNMLLSLKRAKAVLELLVKSGVDESLMHIAYHGEGDLVVPTPDNVAEPRNRRVEVVIR